MFDVILTAFLATMILLFIENSLTDVKSGKIYRFEHSGLKS